ncbi:ABC transporter ATP-binding protein [Lutispora sp.]|uniref:ABC transporter ATP-binding protein n=1 Tax=Lutispora sp. TaxID=2828727 RepID=UPI002B2035EB|nr:ABC transporter ATP-binding protein [Lutispora sp.]MEA4962406.1 ABC transporter ATP-binding protein [Lutispora sp.]
MKKLINLPLIYSIRIVFESSPLYASLIILHAIVIGVLPSILVMLEANFIDQTLDLLKTGFDISRIVLPMTFLVLAIIFMWLAKSLKSTLRTFLLSSVRGYLLPQIYDKKATLDYKDYENTEICNLISRVSLEPELTVTNAFLHLLLLISDLIVVASLFLVIATHAWQSAILVFVISIPLFILAMKSGKANYEATKRTIQLERKSKYLDTVLSDKSTAHERSLFQYGKEMIDQCYEINESIRKILVLTRLKWFIKMKTGSIIIAFISLSITLFMINSLSKGEITIGLFAALVNAVFKLVNKLSWELTDVMDSLAKKSEYLKDLKSFNQLKSDYISTEGKGKSNIEFNSIEFKNVSFKYPNSAEYVLKDLSFKITAGKHYALIGVNGAGKTTITKLMIGLYKEYDGEILINDLDIKNYQQKELRDLFSVVFQDFAKYQISIKDNILLPIIQQYEVAILEEKLQEVINKLDLHNLLDDSPKGIDTELGKLSHDSVELSHGQWQRIAIARAIAVDTPFYILDEPCSALDAINEQKLYWEYDHLLKGKTTISISHRLGATKIANEIIVISSGRMIAVGSHDDLYETCRLYRDMYDKQKGWYENAS